MKIFISYSRRDAGDFANQVHRHLSSFKHDIFTDINNIKAGNNWSNVIEENISNCDIFVVIVTNGALQSSHVEREVLQAQKENKAIIPCFHRSIIDSYIKWGLEKIQGVEFFDKFELARNIDSEIANMSREGIVTSTGLENINTLINNGNILYDQAKYVESIEWFDKVLKLDPNNESIQYKKFQAIEHLPKASFKTYYNKKIKARALSDDLVSYLQQKNFKVIWKSDHQNNTYFIIATATKTNKLTKLVDTSSQDIQIKVRGNSSNLEILLSIVEVKKNSLKHTASSAALSMVGMTTYVIPVLHFVKVYNNTKLMQEIWKFIEKKTS